RRPPTRPPSRPPSTAPSTPPTAGSGAGPDVSARAGRVLAAPRHRPRTRPAAPTRRTVDDTAASLPLLVSLSVITSEGPWASATGPMAEAQVRSPHNSTKSGLTPLCARIRRRGFPYRKKNRRPPAGWPAVLRHCLALLLVLHWLGTAPGQREAGAGVVPYRPPSRPVSRRERSYRMPPRRPPPSRPPRTPLPPTTGRPATIGPTTGRPPAARPPSPTIGRLATIGPTSGSPPARPVTVPTAPLIPASWVVAAPPTMPPTMGRLETIGPTTGRPPAMPPAVPTTLAAMGPTTGRPLTSPPAPPAIRPPTMGRPPRRPLAAPVAPVAVSFTVFTAPLTSLLTSCPGRKLTKGRLLSVLPRFEIASAEPESDWAAKAGMVPAAPSAKLRTATAARRCVFLDKVLPFFTHRPPRRRIGSVATATAAEIRIPVPQRVIRREWEDSSPSADLGLQPSSARAALNVGLGRIAASARAGSGT